MSNPNISGASHNAYFQPEGDAIVFGLPGVEAHEIGHGVLEDYRVDHRDVYGVRQILADHLRLCRFEDVRGLGDEGMADVRAAIQSAQNVIKVN